MDIQQLHSAVQEALNRRDYEHGFELLDRFIQTATGSDLGRGLRMKASAIVCDPRRAPEGLALVDEALEMLRSDPEDNMRTLTTALGLCLTVGDVDKANLYEGLAHQSLQEYGDHPGVRRMQHRLYINLGMLANLRNQHPTAYWHFVQSVSCLEHPDIPSQEKRFYLFMSYLQIADTCILMDRGPEAAEALEKARPLIAGPGDLGRWSVCRARLLRSRNRFQEAQGTLDAVECDAQWHSSDRAQFHLEQALIAQDLGDVRRFHSHLATAREIAEENSLEFVLCKIQRAQRAPMTVEVV